MQAQDTTAAAGAGTARRAALYLRVSTEEQGQEGYSLPNQRAALEQYALARGWTVAGVWTDIESGRTDGRAGYQALLAAARQWDVLLVWRVDRLGRDTAELFRVARELRRAGRQLVSATENVDDPFVMGMLFLMAERESWLIGERVRPVVRRLRAEGRHVSRPPYGYRMVEGRLVVDPDQAALYHEAVERALAGESVRAIIRDWNRRGVPGPGGATWDNVTLSRLLRNPVHAGLVAQPGPERALVAGRHEALLDRARWEALQAHLDRARGRWSHVSSRGPAALLVGLGRCVCGAPMVHTLAGPPGRQKIGYYLCDAQRGDKGCPLPSHSVRADSLEAAVRWVLGPLLAGDAAALLDHYQAAGRIEAETAEAALARARERLTEDLARAERGLARLVELLALGDITREEYATARATFLERQAQAQAALATLPAPGPVPAGVPAAVARQLATLGGLYDAAPSLAARRELLVLLGLTFTREAGGVWVRVAPAWRPWTRGDTLFPFLPARAQNGRASARLVLPSVAEASPYATERIIGIAAD
jgi:site-specific DNA recombinase